ncbi:MAG: hypothetical protein ACTHJS_01590 [Xanthobacteraceae bacterium]
MLNDPDFDHETSNQMRELTIDELEGVSGGTVLPPPGEAPKPKSVCPCGCGM